MELGSGSRVALWLEAGRSRIEKNGCVCLPSPERRKKKSAAGFSFVLALTLWSASVADEQWEL